MIRMLALYESDWCYPRHVGHHHAEPDGIKPLTNTRALLFSICSALDKSQRHKGFALLALGDTMCADYSPLETGTLVIRNSVAVRGSLHIMPRITEVQRFLGLPSWVLD